jgi:hypothetical protein
MVLAEFAFRWHHFFISLRGVFGNFCSLKENVKRKKRNKLRDGG